jgi:NADPH:quinone reductase-like Zn-dependent oxidoreductase
MKGAEVYATAAGDARELLEGLGADRVIDYHTEAFEEIVSDVDLVYDLIGGATERRSWQVLRRGGCFISTVQQPDPDKVLDAGVMACRYTARADGDQLRRIASLVDNGHVRVIINRVFPLAEAAEAERHLQNDHVTGKVVLEVAAS